MTDWYAARSGRFLLGLEDGHPRWVRVDGPFGEVELHEAERMTGARLRIKAMPRGGWPGWVFIPVEVR